MSRATDEAGAELQRLRRRLDRERRARLEAETIAERATRELFEKVVALRQSKVVLDETPDFVAIATLDGKPSYLNRAFHEMLGIVPGEPTGVNLWQLFDSSAGATLARDAMPSLLAKGVWRGELGLLAPSGSTIPVSQVFVAHRGGDGQIDSLSSVSHDITERHELAARLAQQALHDPLTGLPNRLLILDRLDRALQRSARDGSLVGVLFLDLDRFKLINDGLGHGAGDELLCLIAGRVQASVRSADTVGRLGGDEFIAVCEDVHSEADLLLMVDRIEAELAKPYMLGADEVFVGTSIGIALGSGNEDSEEVIRRADEAMYQAKRSGKGRYEVFREGLRAQAAARLETENDLHRALASDELVLHYQPIVELPESRMVAVDALLRWQHPVRGLLAPGEFIHLAEESGLIVPIGNWVVEEACRQAARWREGDPALRGLRVAVNLSPRQLLQPGLAGVAAEALASTGTDPACLAFEISESVLMAAESKALDELARLRELGVSLGTDDFGTGYSSFSCLKHFKVDFIKIHRSFVSGLGHSAEDGAITDAILSLGLGLGLRVIAEGVETEEQLRHLKMLECRFAQGYHFARPLPPEAIAAFAEASP